MMRRLLFILMIFVAAPVHAAELKLELARDKVDITTGFNGTQLPIFGISDDPKADIVITLTGPENTVVVRKKNRVGGAWMNTDSVQFRRVPSYYDYALTRAETEIGDSALMGQQAIGISGLGYYSEDANDDPQKVDSYRDALVSDMQSRGFYPLKYKDITLIEPTFFRVAFDLPPGVPTGLYTVKGLLVRNGEIVAEEIKSLQVGQVGFNARVYLFATENAFFYGIFTILIALISGWSAFTFLRRD